MQDTRRSGQAEEPSANPRRPKSVPVCEFLRRQIERMQAAPGLTPRDILYLLAAFLPTVTGPRDVPTSRPVREDDAVAWEGRLLASLRVVCDADPSLLAGVCREIGARSEADWLRDFAAWFTWRKGATREADGERLRHVEWWELECDRLALSRTPFLLQETLTSVRACWRDKGVKRRLPRDDETLRSDVVEVLTGPQRRVSGRRVREGRTEGGNTRLRWDARGFVRLNENRIVDGLRAVYAARDRHASIGAARARSHASEWLDVLDATDAADVTRAVAMTRACKKRGGATLAALSVHAGALSYRRASLRFGVSVGAIQRAIPWVRTEYPALRSRRRAAAGP